MKNHILSFLWQNTLLVVSLFLMTLGVALSVHSQLGSSVISTIPYVLSLAGENGLTPALSIGAYTIIMNAVFVAVQIILLRRKFELVQLFQLLVGFLFGAFLDINIAITNFIVSNALAVQILVQFLGCTILGIAIAFEVRCQSITMPGEGITVALSKVTGLPFPNAKICVDTSLVCIAIALGYYFFGKWQWEIVGPGTLFAMVYVGIVVKSVNPHLGWFDRLLAYIPGFRRYIFGLARFIAR